MNHDQNNGKDFFSTPFSNKQHQVLSAWSSNTWQDQKKIKLEVFDLGLGFPFTIFCPYLRHLYPSLTLAASEAACTIILGSLTVLRTGAGQGVALSIILFERTPNY